MTEIEPHRIAQELDDRIEAPPGGLAARVVGAAAEQGRQRRWSVPARLAGLSAIVAVLLSAALVLTLVESGRIARPAAKPAATAGAVQPEPTVGAAQPEPMAPPAADPLPAANVRPGPGFHGWFVSADTGWVVASGSSSTALFKTVDGGGHWVRQLSWPAPALNPKLRILDAQTGFVGVQVGGAGAALYRTTDGGSRWEQLRLPGNAGQFQELDFISASQGWLLLKQPTTLFHTVDAGEHWENLAPSGPYGQGGLRFDSASRGWAAYTATPVAIETTDGGKTWTFVAFQDPPGEAPSVTSAPIFFDSANGVMAAAFSAPRFALYVYRSGNGGRGWGTPVRVPNAGGLDVQFQAVSSQSWFAVTGGPGSSVEAGIESTGDGGTTWHQLPAHLAGDVYVAGIDFVSPESGWAWTARALGPGLLKTQDGGATWTSVAMPGP